MLLMAREDVENHRIIIISQGMTYILLGSSGDNFTNIFKSSFCTDILAPKSTSIKCKYKKATHETFVQKSC